MHIRDEKRFEQAMINIFKTCKNQILFRENWNPHNLLSTIKKLHAMKKIPWEKIFFYYDEIDLEEKAQILIILSCPLEFPKLSDYNLSK